MSSLNTDCVYTTLSNLPSYFISHAPISVVVDTYRLFLSVSGHYPSNPFPLDCYLDLIERFVDLLVHVLSASTLYSPFHLQTQEQIQIPETALEEAIMLLQILPRCYSKMSTARVVIRILFHSRFFEQLNWHVKRIQKRVCSWSVYK